MLKAINKRDLQIQLLAERKPILVDFYAEWCAPCKRLMPVLENVAATYADQVAVYKVNVESAENQTLRERYEIKNLPTLILFQKALPVGKRVGSQTEDQLARWILSAI